MQDLNQAAAARHTFEADGETVQFDHRLLQGRGHQYTLVLFPGDMTGRSLSLYLRPVTDSALGKTPTAVANLTRPIYQSRASTTDIASTVDITAAGIYDIRGDFCHLVVVAHIGNEGVGDPMVVDVGQLIG